MGKKISKYLEKDGSFKRREIKKDWKSGDRNIRKEMIKKEIDKVAPTWVSNRKKVINELELDGEDEDFNREFTWDEFIRAVERSKDKSSPGIDGVEYDMIKRVIGLKRKFSIG